MTRRIIKINLVLRTTISIPQCMWPVIANRLPIPGLNKISQIKGNIMKLTPLFMTSKKKYLVYLLKTWSKINAPEAITRAYVEFLLSSGYNRPKKPISICLRYLTIRCTVTSSEFSFHQRRILQQLPFPSTLHHFLSNPSQRIQTSSKRKIPIV